MLIVTNLLDAGILALLALAPWLPYICCVLPYHHASSVSPPCCETLRGISKNSTMPQRIGQHPGHPRGHWLPELNLRPADGCAPCSPTGHPSPVAGRPLYALLFLQFSCAAVTNPARRSLIPLIVPPAQLHLAATIDAASLALMAILGLQ